MEVFWKNPNRFVSFFCCCCQDWLMRRCSWKYQVNISYLSVIHCFITFILLRLSRCSLLLFLLLLLARVCQPGTQRAAGGGAARRFSEETCASSVYKVPAGPAQILTFEYRQDPGRAPQKGRCGPLACCILARRLQRGHPDEEDCPIILQRQSWVD